jgi:hypothetical protein
VFGKGKVFLILAILVLLLVTPASALINGGYIYNQSPCEVTENTYVMAAESGTYNGTCSGALRWGHCVQGGTCDLSFDEGSTPYTIINPWANNSPTWPADPTYNHVSASSYCNGPTWGWGWWEFKRWTILGGYTYPTNPVNANFTFTVIDNTTGETVPWATVSLTETPYVTAVQHTNLYGETVFSNVPTAGMFPNNMTVTASKVGYNTTILSFLPSYTATSQAFTIKLDDIAWTGAQAQVFVDTIDLDDGSGISGAAVGIENTTSTINQWYYTTSSTPTYQFNTTYGGINLSVGQAVVFAGYKEGVYTANNSGTYVIPSAISHTSLFLKKVSGNATATYQWPVSVVDATTGYTIADSYLNSSLTSGSVYYNRSSPTGKFNVTGTGATGTYPISLGDQLTLVGTKDGYQYNWFSLIMTTTNNGVTQYINLMPSSALPLNTEFAALVSVYEAGTTKALGGARVAITPGIQNTTTNSVGAAAFQNLTALKTYTATVSKSGFSTTTKTFTGTNQSITTVDVSLSPSSVNPTIPITPTGGVTTIPTVVPTTLPGGNYGGFFGPWYTALHKMGAYDTELNILLTAIIVIIMAVLGAVATGWSPIGFNSGAALGFILCCGFQIIYFWLILAGIAWLLLPLVLRRYTT